MPVVFYWEFIKHYQVGSVRKSIVVVYFLFFFILLRKDKDVSIKVSLRTRYHVTYLNEKNIIKLPNKLIGYKK